MASVTIKLEGEEEGGSLAEQYSDPHECIKSTNAIYILHNPLNLISL